MTPEKVLELVGIDFIERPNRLAVCCPFHHDTDPSAGFYLDTELFHCFACGITDDVVRFYGRLRDLNYREAREELEKEFGEYKPKERPSPTVLRRERRRGEEALRGIRHLPMERHAKFGEALDTILLRFERGAIGQGELDAILEKWYNKVSAEESR